VILRRKCFVFLSAEIPDAEGCFMCGISGSRPGAANAWSRAANPSEQFANRRANRRFNACWKRRRFAPGRPGGTRDGAVIEHDLNVYRVLFALGSAGTLHRRDIADLDFGMLEVPAVDPEPRSRRLLRLDIQTALRLMNIPFALCLTREEYRRAVHSLRLDTSLLTVLTTLTGDAAFLGWRSAILPLRVDGNVDVPLTVYEHAVLCEYAHARLSKLTNGPTGPA
jgi:hypothetical protein